MHVWGYIAKRPWYNELIPVPGLLYFLSLYIFMKFNTALVGRSLIAILFIFAGYQKLTNFSDNSGFIGSLTGVTSPTLAMIVTALVIVVEIPVAALFAWGYRVCITGWTLVIFVAITIILVHNPWASALANNTPAMQMAMMMALKNLAIIGGILLGIWGCNCGVCPPSKKRHTHQNN